jgi:hypothetical protein
MQHNRKNAKHCLCKGLQQSLPQAQQQACTCALLSVGSTNLQVYKQSYKTGTVIKLYSRYMAHWQQVTNNR